MLQNRLFSITFQKLRIFAAVARERSFSKAADAVFLSTPTVSDQVKSLENIIGMKLLHRSPGRGAVELTEAGEILFQSYLEIFGSLDKADKALAAVRGLERGVVNLGMVLTFGGKTLTIGDQILPLIYDNFRQAQPGIEVRVHVDEDQHLLDGLSRRELDLALLLGLGADEQTGLVFEALTPIYLVLVGPLGHRLAGVPPAHFAELAHERLILGNHSTYLRKVLDRMASEAGISLSVALEVSNFDARLEGALRGVGITIVSTLAAASEITSGKLSLLHVQGFPIRMECFVVHQPTQLTPGAQALKDHLLRSRGVLQEISVASGTVLTTPDSGF